MPFLKQTFTNIINNTDNALTGPIPRNDKQTLLSDLQALKKDNYFKIFKETKTKFKIKNNIITNKIFL